MNRLIEQMETSVAKVRDPAEKLLAMNREAVRHFNRDFFF